MRLSPVGTVIPAPRSRIPYAKRSLSIPEQVSQLQARGLAIEDASKVAELLSHINYFRFEAYWFTFYDRTQMEHCFVPGTTFDVIWKHYCFDRKLRAHIAYALERIEVSFRTQFAYYLSQDFGPFPLNLQNLQFSSDDWNKELGKLRKICRDSKELFAQHFFSKYSDDILPIWALVEIQSFGAIVFYYKRLKSRVVKARISMVYGLNPSELTSWLEHLYYIRNTCAHHSRLWNKRLTILPRPPQRIISQEHGLRWIYEPTTREVQDPYNERRLFNTVLIIDYFFTQICPDSIWKRKLVALIKDYSIDAIRMGFPTGWEDDSFWQ